MGQWRRENKHYLEMLGDSKIHPLTRLAFFGVDSNRSWDKTLTELRKYLGEQRREGRIALLNMGLGNPKADRFAVRRKNRREFSGFDARVANTNEFDERIFQVADIMKEHGEPVFLRLGAEFNGSWNDYHPYIYPKAFRKIVTVYRNRGVDNVAFVWCYEPAAEDDFDARSATGEYKWFPGEDVIDWFAIDIFKREHFSAAYPLSTERGLTPRGRTERFLKMARKYKKPVMVAESSVVDVDVESEKLWEEWFAPYFAFLEAHPEIKAFVYVNADWPRYRSGDPFQWKDGRLHLNRRASRLYIKEMKEERYLHCGQSHLLNGFALENTPGEGRATEPAQGTRKPRFLKTW
jgi:hypothetical protein